MRPLTPYELELEKLGMILTERQQAELDDYLCGQRAGAWVACAVIAVLIIGAGLLATCAHGEPVLAMAGG